MQHPNQQRQQEKKTTKRGHISANLLFSGCPVGWTGDPASQQLRHYVYGETGQHIRGNAKCWSCLYSTCWEDLFFTRLYKDSTTDQKSPRRLQQIQLTTTNHETKLHTLHWPANRKQLHSDTSQELWELGIFTQVRYWLNQTSKF